MQIGDLVRVRPEEPSAGNLGVIVTLDIDMIKVYWLDGSTYWIDRTSIEKVEVCDESD